MSAATGLSPEQLRVRREGTTATDVAAIVGVHPHRSKLDVWLDKTGNAAPFVETRRSKWGQILEPRIREDYEQLHRVRVTVPGTLRHPDYPTHLATPDGIVYLNTQEPERGLEIKVHGRDAVYFGGLEYGPPGTDEVPAHELVQCMWGVHVTRLLRWDLVAFLDGEPIEYTIERDDELVWMLATEADRFHRDHVVTQIPPPPDGSKAWDEWLKVRWRKNTDELVKIDGDEPTLELLNQLRALRNQAVSVENQIDRVVQSLKDAIGEAAGFTWRDPDRPKPAKLTWKFSKPSVKTKWRETATAQRAAARLALELCMPELAQIQRMARAEGAHGDAITIAVDTVLAALRDIVDGTIEKKHTYEIPGPRVFLAPRYWKQTKADEKAATDKDNEDAE